MSMLGRMFGIGRNEHYDKGIRLFDQGLFAEAIAELALSGQGSPDELTDRLTSFYIAESHAALGTAALEAENYPAARAAFAAALAINPHYADLHFQLGRAARGDGGDHAAALTAFDSALSVNPRYARALFYRGLTLYALDRPAEALVAVQSAAAVDPAFAAPPYADALAAHEGGDYATASAQLTRIAETDIDDITFHSRLGEDLYRRGMYAESAAEFEKALALADYADLHNSLAIARTAEKRYADAIAGFNRALALNPKYTEARTNLALTLRAAGMPREADIEFRRVLEDDPANAVARDGLGLKETNK